VLEIVVPGDDRSGNFTRVNGVTVERGDDADLVRLDARQEELVGRHAMLGRVRRSNHREQRAVEAIGAGGENAELASLLTAVEQELARVLKVVALDDFPQDAFGGNRRA